MGALEWKACVTAPAVCNDESIHQVKEFDDVLTVLGIARVTHVFGRDALV